MEIIVALNIFAIVGTLAGVLAYYLMRRKFLGELSRGRKREEELRRKVYETEVLKEIGERIGYSLNAVKIIEIISGSLGRLLPYSTVSYMVNESGKITFFCNVHEPVSEAFIGDVKVKML